MKEYQIRSGLFGRKRKWVLCPEFVQFEQSDLKGEPDITFYKADIVDVKYGMDWITWYTVTVGRHFAVTFKHKDGRELAVSFKEFTAFDRGYNGLYANVVNDLWTYYLTDLVDGYLVRLYDRGETFELGGINFKHEGVEFAGSGGVLAWPLVSLQTYHGYFALFKTDNPNINKRFAFNEWDAEVIYSLLRTVKSDKDEQSGNALAR